MSPDKQPRQPKGKTDGGQFAELKHPEARVDLTADFGVDRPAIAPINAAEFLAQRAEALSRGGFVPAVTTALLVDPRSTKQRSAWWNRHFAAGEFAHPAGVYAQFPDDWTPSHTSGASIAGHRRTHRMAYVNEDVALRMPSVASIKDFSNAEFYDKQPGDTFDVPISATFPGGQFDGWVRVARGGDGSWATQGLGFAPDQSAYIAEAVQCVLEARHPSRALSDAGDLLARRRQRAAELGVSMEPIKSTWIAGLAYEPVTGTMLVGTDTKSGHNFYGYEAPLALFNRIAQSTRPGEVFNEVIRNRVKRVAVNVCDNCQRYFATLKHRCPTKVSPRQRFNPFIERAREHLLGH
jgi:hypothetical protein